MTPNAPASCRLCGTIGLRVEGKIQVITTDIVVTNAIVHTMNPNQPLATWFAVLAGNIVAVGSGDDVPEAKEVIDAGGKTIVPGFFDAHCHTMWFGLSLAELDCTTFSTLDATGYVVREKRAGERCRSALDLHGWLFPSHWHLPPQRLHRGGVADWVVLDKDILRSPVDDIPDIRVAETRVGGRQTFSAS